MCGFCGFTSFNKGENLNNSIIQEMNNSLEHRGPDSASTWCDSNYEIYFGHRRLSIIDLSDCATQPFVSSNGRYVIAYNGEIYNFKTLKLELNIDWKSTSDTEVLIEYISNYGLEKTLDKVEGMFAFALWDNKEKKLTLCRDRIGEKPLYYGFQNRTFMFSSELKAFKKHPDFTKEIDLNALSKYISYGYVPTPLSIFKNIYKLSPGAYIQLNHSELKNPNSKIVEKRYWNYNSRYNNLKNSLANQEDNKLINKLDVLINQSVERQMISDVPLGAFLSGGIDSSLICSIMQKHSNIPVRTFAIGFKERGFDEAIYAKKVAHYLGTDHTELYVSPDDALSVIPKITSIYDEPFSDPSQIPTFLVSKLAKKDVTVSLSGDAGDELFAGYTRYTLAQSLWSIIKIIPYPLRKVIIQLINLTPTPVLNLCFFWIRFIIDDIRRGKNIGDLIKKSTALLSCTNNEAVYRSTIQFYTQGHKMVLNNNNIYNTFGENNVLASEAEGFLNHMISYDMLGYLPDDILVKVDRAAMSNSLETRIPFLSKEIIEFSLALPLKMKIRNGSKKWILKQLLKKYLPSDLFDRPKQGFGIPLAQWIREDLNEWTLDLLSETKIKNQGYLDHKDITTKLNQHLKGDLNWEYHLWTILNFQQWLEDL